MGEGNENFVYSYPWDFKSFLTCRKILTTCDLLALLPIQEEGVLRIFIALKNPSPWLGSNLQHLGPVASTLTTTPPRRPLDPESCSPCWHVGSRSCMVLYKGMHHTISVLIVHIKIQTNQNNSVMMDMHSNIGH
jgi:hypothetical protein